MANNKVTEMVKQKTKVKITGSASTPPRLSKSMIKSQPKTTTGKKPSTVQLTTKKKIQTAEIRKGLADARVKNDKWLGAYAEYTGSEKKGIKAQNVRKAVDASKTAGRAKNVARKLK